jgi:hypothetical protein
MTGDEFSFILNLYFNAEAGENMEKNIIFKVQKKFPHLNAQEIREGIQSVRETMLKE